MKIAHSGVAAAVLSGAAALVLTAPAHGSAPGVAQGTPTTSSEYSYSCAWGGDNLNISYSPGDTTMTIYYNNHCDHPWAIKTYGLDGWDCFTVNSRTKGDETVYLTTDDVIVDYYC